MLPSHWFCSTPAPCTPCTASPKVVQCLHWHEKPGGACQQQLCTVCLVRFRCPYQRLWAEVMIRQLHAANKQAASMMGNAVAQPLALIAARMFAVKQTKHTGFTASIWLKHAVENKGL